jgi:hypothetical protein
MNIDGLKSSSVKEKNTIKRLGNGSIIAGVEERSSAVFSKERG